ncbi:MAG: hypothetical protein CL916_00335 [Deltaproteobacteria bacterium]|nr:hypothetical protein [Deltaproteobacteria bacterium]
MAYGERWEKKGKEEDIHEAVKGLYHVVCRSWERFPEIEIIALMELNRLLHLAKKSGISTRESIDPRLIKHLDLDVRISMSWDADLVDIDLHVDEPTGETAYYSHCDTKIGGHVSRDFTDGYGPEEYILRRGYKGEYKIRAHYYGSHQQGIAGPCTVIVHVFTNYGRKDEQRQCLMLRLEKSGADFTVGTIKI